MDAKLGYFFKTIGLEKEQAQKIFSNPKLKTLKDKVKSSVFFVLKNHPSVNKEIERKILGINSKKIIKILVELGAKQTYKGIIKDNRYDFADSLFKKENIVLRTRKIKGKNIITLKKKNNLDTTINSNGEELEVEINDIEYLIQCFKNIGLNIVEGKQYTKYRISYELDGMHFDFDKYSGKSGLLEIESDDANKIDDWITKLGLDDYEQIGDGYNDYIDGQKTA